MKPRRDLLAQGERAWPRFLRSIVTGETFFPLAVHIGKTRLAVDYVARKAELDAFHRDAAALGLTVRWEERGHRRFQAHELPASATWQDEAAYLKALGRFEKANAFREDLALFPPELRAWVTARPLDVVENHGVWPELLRVVQWFRAHRRCGLYLRQLPVEGVDTKFFERHRAVLDKLLLEVQSDAVDATATRFEVRHGLAWEEPLVRFRFLDPALQAARAFRVADLAVPAPTFRALPFSGVNAIVTENLRNFLALPPLPHAVAIFGSGDAASVLAGADWLGRTRILYWGDMDARGFAILARLRAAYPATESVLMDAATLEAHRVWASPAAISPTKIEGLLPAEAAAVERLGAEGLWLEQERIPFKAVSEAFTALVRAAPLGAEHDPARP
jgi:hypothetical protein